jgi:hypothetical protein
MTGREKLRVLSFLQREVRCESCLRACCFILENILCKIPKLNDLYREIYEVRVVSARIMLPRFVRLKHFNTNKDYTCVLSRKMVFTGKAFSTWVRNRPLKDWAKRVYGNGILASCQHAKASRTALVLPVSGAAGCRADDDSCTQNHGEQPWSCRPTLYGRSFRRIICDRRAVPSLLLGAKRCAAERTRNA